MSWLNTSARQTDLFGGPPRARRLAEEPHMRRLACTDGPLDYQLRRSRRRTIGFRVDDSGLTVSAPGWLSLGDVEKAITSKLPWIRRTLTAWISRAAHTANVEWRDGSELCWLGGRVVITLHSDTHRPQLLLSSPTESNGCGGHSVCIGQGAPDRLLLPLDSNNSAEKIREMALEWLKSEARRVFADRLMRLAPQLQLQVGKWRLSSARRRWGSCSADGSIRLNWRLILFPIWIIDYVIIHELAHRHEMNHGPRFWSLVASIHSDWKLAEQWLKQEAPKLLGTSYD